MFQLFLNSCGMAVNLYISTYLPDGSTLGLSANSTGFTSEFVPGGTSYGPPNPADGLIVTSTPGSYEVEIPWTYLTTDPDHLGFQPISAANDEVRLDLSQSFSYSVAGGSDVYGNDELGITTYSPVPEPTTVIAGVSMLLPFGASFLRTMRKKNAA